MAGPSQSARDNAAAKGQALPGGRFPIRNKADLQKAVHAVGRVRPNTDAARAKVRRFIIKRASALGASDAIPDNWNSDGSLK